MLNNKNILITGGTGSFGKQFEMAQKSNANFATELLIKIKNEES